MVPPVAISRICFIKDTPCEVVKEIIAQAAKKEKRFDERRASCYNMARIPWRGKEDNMKKVLMWLTVLALMLTGAAFADQENAPVMLVKLPEDAQMVENVAFDDGDFVQTYQLSGGAYVQLLRYAQGDVTLDGIVAGDWPGATDIQSMALETSRRLRGEGADAQRRAGGRGGRARGAGARVGGSLRRWCIRRCIRSVWATIKSTTRCSAWSIRWMCSAVPPLRTSAEDAGCLAASFRKRKGAAFLMRKNAAAGQARWI